MLRRFLVRAIVMAPILAALAAVAATGAQAAQVFHAHGSFSTTDTVCGIPGVIIDIQSDQNTVTNADGSFKTTGAFRQTYTNPVNGKSVIIYTAGQSPTGTAYVFDQAADTVTFDLIYKGLPEKIQAPNGPVLIRDAGSITLQEVFDLTTGDNISETIVAVSGPHPVAESAFNISCDIVDAAIG
jgi:hypothetical protein